MPVGTPFMYSSPPSSRPYNVTLLWACANALNVISAADASKAFFIISSRPLEKWNQKLIRYCSIRTIPGIGRDPVPDHVPAGFDSIWILEENYLFRGLVL
jgi:hypothetical protein